MMLKSGKYILVSSKITRKKYKIMKPISTQFYFKLENSLALLVDVFQ